MREVTYTDPEGRKWWVLLPEGVPDSESYRGIPVGPPPVDALGLPFEMAVRLHNELYHRRIFTEREAVRRQVDIVSAIRAAVRLDAQSVIALYSDRAILAQDEGRE